MESNVSETAYMDIEVNRDMESSLSRAIPTVYEDPTWNMLMTVHADEIGHRTCSPTDLIECSSGKGWWR
eukprot:9943856-Heterocapsa_arctica.AAC.1